MQGYTLAGTTRPSFASRVGRRHPAVRLDDPLLDVRAARRGPADERDRLFLERARAGVGVTGSNGKSTTCTCCCGHAGRSGRQAWLGGNMERACCRPSGSIAPDVL